MVAECTQHLDQYFEWRAMQGETLTDTSPVIRKEFSSLNVVKPKPITVFTINWLINSLLDKSCIRPRSEKKGRSEIMQCHAFRKYFESTAKLGGMDLILINRCMGHSTGLEDSYLKLSDQDVLEGSDKMGGYVSVINSLTINSEFILKSRITELEAKTSEVEELRQQMAEIKETNNEVVQLLKDPAALLKLVNDEE